MEVLEEWMPNNSLKEHLLAIVMKSKEILHSKIEKTKKSEKEKEVESSNQQQHQNTNEQSRSSLKVHINFSLDLRI